MRDAERERPVDRRGDGGGQALHLGLRHSRARTLGLNVRSRIMPKPLSQILAFMRETT